MFRISPFRLSTFRRCRRQYKYRYVEHIPSEPSASETMGQHVHTTLRDLMLLPEEYRTPARAIALLRGHWSRNRAGFRGLAEEARWRARAMDQLDRFTHTEHVVGHPVALERYIESDLSSRIRLMGRIDRIDQDGDGLHVMDYKTSRQPEDVDGEQLHLYAMMVSRQDNRPVTKATFTYLEDGTSWSTNPTDATLGQTAEGVVEAVEAISGERQYQPTIGRHCAFCEFQRICPKREEIVGRRLTEGW